MSFLFLDKSKSTLLIEPKTTPSDHGLGCKDSCTVACTSTEHRSDGVWLQKKSIRILNVANKTSRSGVPDT